MKLQFKVHQYQSDAVDAVAECFAGQPKHDGVSYRIDPGRQRPIGSPALFELRVGDNHHHVVCRSCGIIADIDCAVGEAPCLTPSDHDGALDGFVLDEAEVIYWGLCPDCSAAQASRSHP